VSSTRVSSAGCLRPALTASCGQSVEATADSQPSKILRKHSCPLASRFDLPHSGQIDP
jgi:hypothetical protein